MKRLGAALLLGLAGCGGSEEPVPGPLALSSPVLAQGEQVFMAHCNQCHPRGKAGLGPGLDFPAPGFLVRMQVRQGLGAMPHFDEEQIPPEELDALIQYLPVLRSAI